MTGRRWSHRISEDVQFIVAKVVKTFGGFRYARQTVVHALASVATSVVETQNLNNSTLATPFMLPSTFIHLRVP